MLGFKQGRGLAGPGRELPALLSNFVK